ncbi:S41 family peptidase [Flavobacterium okayamense]|uniref:Tail specific protease domain-containing protein n=1 Tax=Flavobacterium okayamense TaxID=2830782 RepID=A0ABM7S894_9FLAO|nr:S41 family peptidase [Flavobacterium okayamense]BCY28968.1 hypothetical protein KK2020170_18360 [Flavobacterium okayamense]
MKLNSLTYLLLLSSSFIMSQTKAYIKTEEAKADLEELIQTFEEVHYNPYFKTSKEEFNFIKAQTIENWDKDSIALKNFVATGMKLTALLSGGHSYMDWQNLKLLPEIKRYSFLPLTGKIINGKFVVTKSKLSNIKVNDTVQTINGLGTLELYEECLSYIGGIDGFKNATCEKAFPLYLFFNQALQPPYDIVVSQYKRSFSKGIDLNELIEFINSEQVKSDYTFDIIEDNIGLISYNSCNDYEAFTKFLKETFQKIKDLNVDKLIIDIRENGGGNSKLNDLLLSYITKKDYRQSSGRYWKVSEKSKKVYSENKVYEDLFGKEFLKKYLDTPNQEVIESFTNDLVTPISVDNFFNGKTCFLIGPNTFSSANFLADAIKTYNISTLIGLPTGEYTNDFGEQFSFTLKNSGNLVFVSSTYDIGANGNKDVLEPVMPDILVDSNILKYSVKWLKSYK